MLRSSTSSALILEPVAVLAKPNFTAGRWTACLGSLKSTPTLGFLLLSSFVNSMNALRLFCGQVVGMTGEGRHADSSVSLVLSDFDLSWSSSELETDESESE